MTIIKLNSIGENTEIEITGHSKNDFLCSIHSIIFDVITMFKNDKLLEYNKMSGHSKTVIKDLNETEKKAVKNIFKSIKNKYGNFNEIQLFINNTEYKGE